MGTEHKLSGLDPLLQNLRLRIRRVDGEILDAVRRQSTSGNRAKQDLDHANRAIQDLFGRIKDIQAKAEQSELMVQEICRDIKKLDLAKRNLTATITALRRLAMLVSAVDQLEGLASKRIYREAAHMLEAVNQLSAHFDGFKNIPKISEMRGKIDTIKLMLRSAVFKDFEGLASVDPERDCSALTAQLSEACAVVDVLEPFVRDELTGQVCNREMTAYTQVFSTTGETGRLDRTERRYAWFKRQLRGKEDVWALFPPSWGVPQMLCMAFCRLTRAHLAQILDDQATAQAAGAESNVQAILMALHKTLEFETDLEERFGGTHAVLAAGQQGGEGAEAASAGQPGKGDDGSSAAAMRGKYERLRPEVKLADQRHDDGAAAAGPATRFTFKGSVSSCFEPHLKGYVDLEEKSIYELLDELLAKESWEVEAGATAAVLGCAVALFLNIKKVLKRCSQLTRRETLFRLHQVFQKVLVSFAQRLSAKIPSPPSAVKLSESDEKMVCYIINTAEYCRETVNPLGESVAKTLDKPFSDEIDMTAEEDEFSGVITKALQSLVAGVGAAVEEQLAMLVRTSWATVDAVGDQSEYVTVISTALSASVPRVGGIISHNYFRFFCEKLVTAVVPKVYQSVLRCRRFSEAGAQQLLLDVVAMKQLLLEMPTFGEVLATAPGGYVKLVSREMGKAEALLKVILSPVEGLCDTFRALLPDSPTADFKTVLDLKGLKKSEQTALTEEWSRRAGVASLSRPATSGGGGMSGMRAGGMNMNMPSMQSMSMSMAGMSMPSMPSMPSSTAFKSKLSFMRGDSADADKSKGDQKSSSSIFNWRAS